MAPRREIPEGTAAGELARFLVGLVRGATVRELAEKLGKSPSAWGNYLNGAQLIPKALLGRLVEAYTTPGQVRQAKAVRAKALWTAAAAERRQASAGGGLVHQHQRRDDALQQAVKYRRLAENAEKHLKELQPILALTQSRLENAELQLRQAGERERTRIELQLSQAKERLSRVKLQQERARSRRLTAEEQQDFWLAEAAAAHEEINRLEREARDLAVPDSSVATLPREDSDVASRSDTEIDILLEHIEAEGREDEAEIELDLEPDSVETELVTITEAPRDGGGQEDAPLVIESVGVLEDHVRQPQPVEQTPVQPLSNVPLDKPSTSTDIQRGPAEPPLTSARDHHEDRAPTDTHLLDWLSTADTPQAVAHAFASLREREGGAGRWPAARLAAAAFGEGRTRSQNAVLSGLEADFLPESSQDLQALVRVLGTQEEVHAFDEAYKRVFEQARPLPAASSPLRPVPKIYNAFYVVSIPLLFAIPTGFVTGLRADPGPAGWKLAIYAVVGTLVASGTWVLQSLLREHVEGRFDVGPAGEWLSMTASVAFVMGLIISAAGFDYPGRWVAGAVGFL
ncbi:helix-turn-helix domain-containing protein [Streptomyces katrae]|uniref:Uncharacterized protein n=1 Tax=Streptomyces katrae TaxID=68223 RepID=A0A0F4ITP2_9ACTN|nr:helix-turn-helix transcriptional regulator [Streptomyces katrae]KJY24046.1 hypothetical protein VR44_36465 [Streptomyces katrae]